MKSGDEKLKETIDTFFKGFDKKEAPKPPPSTTDAPNIKMFMVQLLNKYHDLAGGDGMEWEREFNDKKNNKRYKVKIVLCEMKD